MRAVGAPPSLEAPAEERRAHVRRLAWSGWGRAMVGNTVAATTLGILLVGSVRVYPGGVPFRRLMIAFVALGAVSYVAASIVMRVVADLIVKRYVRWYLDGRHASPAETARLAKLPRMVATSNAGAWAGTAVAHMALISPLSGYRFEGWALPKTIAFYSFGFVIGSVLAYLLMERAFRPYLRLVLPRDVTAWPKSLGLGPRLVLAWFTVAGAPLLLIAFTWVGLTAEQGELGAPVLRMTALLATLVGLIVFLIAGRTITAPLERLQDAQRRVASGDLDQHVVVDEAGEIGALEAGFNDMVLGLRERERMRDVFGRHVGQDVARLAMETDFGSGGTTCEATAMFVDIIGSTGLAQRSDPDAVVAILNRFFDTVVRVVDSEGGLVNKFHGDGALCIFGAPTPQVDHAARGLRATRALAEELAPLGDVAAAIGVSSGPVVAGNVGASDRYEFTVIGDPVNEASRLSDEAKLHPSHVLASERTVRAAGDAGRGWIRGEAIALRGRAQPTITYSPYD